MYRQTFQIQARSDMNPDSTFTILEGHFICKTPNNAEFSVNLVQLEQNGY